MQHEPGEVLLVGAGPGPADLLTLRALHAIEGAQALLYDALVSKEVLALAPQGCLSIQTGKRAGRTSMDQNTINRLMLRLAKLGLKVVRLKGGDPSVFGRSGEEVDYLAAHGVASAIVPGVTAASAAAAQFGFPLTHRGEARRLVLATVRVEQGALVEDGWATCADPEATLALYMARDSFPVVAERLLAAGRSPRTPVAAIENAGAPEARMIRGVLADFAPRLLAEKAQGPVVILVGEVVARAAHAVERAIEAA